MNKNFNFQISTNTNWSFGGKKRLAKKRQMTAQEEYWLNRILRDHSSQIFIIMALFLVMIIGTIIYAAISGNSGNLSKDINLINISR